MNRVTSTQGFICWHITQRLSSITNLNRITHFEPASVCPHGPYAVHSKGSAHTAQQSSISPADCFQQPPTESVKLERVLCNKTCHICMTTSEPMLVVYCPLQSARILFKYIRWTVTVYVMCVMNAKLCLPQLAFTAAAGI